MIIHLCSHVKTSAIQYFSCAYGYAEHVLKEGPILTMRVTNPPHSQKLPQRPFHGFGTLY